MKIKMHKIIDEIYGLEEYLGFRLSRKEITLDMAESHDETFSYGLCQRFYGKDDELNEAITKTKRILSALVLIEDIDSKKISLLFSLLGDMHYMVPDFLTSINCFMKSLSYNKNDITNWIGLAFSIRSYGEVELFEKIMYNLENIYLGWKQDPRQMMDQDILMELTGWN